MAERELKNFNFSMPPEYADEFRRIGDVFGERNQLRWAVAAAAIYRLLEMPDDERTALIQRIYGARHFPATMAEIVGEAKARAGRPHSAKADGTWLDENDEPITKPVRKAPTPDRGEKPKKK